MRTSLVTPALWVFGSLLALAVVASFAVGAGAIHIGAGDIARDVLGVQPLLPRDHAVVYSMRLPRLVLAMLVGGMLALAGAAYQSVFHNPLADPYLLGVSSGAGLAVTLAVVGAGAAVGPRAVAAAFAGGLLAVAATYIAGSMARGGGSATTVVLAGVAVGAFSNAAQTYVQQRHMDKVPAIYSWMLGNLGGASWRTVQVVAVVVALVAFALVFGARTLDTMMVGDDEARTLGLHPRAIRLSVVVAATLGTAAAVAAAGLIGFVGIIVPHTIRLVVGSGHRLVLPLCLIWGAVFLVFADTVGRTVLAPSELSVGVVTAAIGAPFFLYILVRSGRRL